MIGGGRTPRSQIAFVCLLSFIPSLAQGQGNRSAQRFILDYDVPESPAFVALGVTPTNVTRGSASKPVIASLLTEFRTGQKIGGGLALDFAPYFVYGGRLDNIAAYRSDWKKRLLANLQLSLGTIQSETDTNSLRFGLGMRATFYDSHDLLMDPRLTRDIDSVLSADANALAAGGEGEVGAVVPVAGLTDAYRRARERVRTTPGSAVSAGWGMAGVVHGAVANSDSISNVRHRIWVSYRYTFAGGTDLLATGQWKQADGSGTSVRAGAALRANGNDANFAAELYYDSNQGDLKTGRLGVGANAEWRLSRGLGLVAALATEPSTAGGQTVTKLRLRTALRWDMNGEQ